MNITAFDAITIATWKSGGRRKRQENIMSPNEEIQRETNL